MKLKYIFIASIMLLLAACSPDEYDLGSKDVTPADLVRGKAYSLTPDANNSNVIHLKSNMEGYSCVWTHPQGRSQEKSLELKIAFPGKYAVTFGVETRGGIVFAKPDSFEITTTYLGFVQDELWTNLTGGVDSSKTWIPCDYDYGIGEGCTGELTYASPSTQSDASPMEFDNWKSNWNPGKGVTEDDGIFASTMTFSLSAKEGTTVKIVNNTDGAVAEQSGIYMLNKEAHTLSFTDCTILHTQGWDFKATNWATDLKVLTLTENCLQVGIWRDNEGDPWWMVLNFISKKFADNFEKVEPEPELPDGWQDDVSQTVNKTVVWKLSEKTPFNWAELNGSLMNDWSDIDDYPSWAGTVTPDSYSNFSMTMNSSDLSVTFVTLDGTTTSGTYSLSDKGIYSFSVDVPEFAITSNINFSADLANQLRILRIEKDALGNVIAMWLGARSSTKAEYMAYCFVPSSGSSSDPEAEMKKMITAKTWKIDMERTYDVTTSWGAEQGPVIFSDYETWAWNPLPGEHYASGEANVDYGTMKFEMDGSITVKQRKRIYTYEEGGETLVRSGIPQEDDVLETDEVITSTGTWELDLDANTITMSVGMLHPWTGDYAVANWGATTIYSIQENALLLQVLRDAELSGEDEFVLTYVFVPSE